ncbi:GNAT family N-acetyltransferase [Cytobacillus sp. S13-E01]|uniref:GNAT family N-acetyltransferase n=1 Tax=Cytobacillus sp. S13-E01 TaxID=3031326 RepID=UPI0023D7C146|nr:GNAT family N-acetyltransferase [Cytobacillus sp. S13-E01]MDF0726692.1 GNAT family N-acetyltransferase [Cytobacillus sp. S13-E01]
MSELTVQIVQATTNEVQLVAPLFNQYRVYYEQESNESGTVHYLKERLDHNESVIFIACNSEKTEAYGFTQLYPSFSSISMRKTWILNDLFVKDEARRMGIAKKIMIAAHDFAKATDAKGVSLETAEDNLGARRLYESLGYKMDNEYLHYFLSF